MKNSVPNIERKKNLFKRRPLVKINDMVVTICNEIYNTADDIIDFSNIEFKSFEFYVNSLYIMESLSNFKNILSMGIKNFNTALFASDINSISSDPISLKIINI